MSKSYNISPYVSVHPVVEVHWLYTLLNLCTNAEAEGAVKDIEFLNIVASAEGLQNIHRGDFVRGVEKEEVVHVFICKAAHFVPLIGIANFGHPSNLIVSMITRQDGVNNSPEHALGSIFRFGSHLP